MSSAYRCMHCETVVPQNERHNCVRDTARRVTAHGKQVMLDGKHLADAVSDNAARFIADTLEFCGTRLPTAAEKRVAEFFA